MIRLITIIIFFISSVTFAEDFTLSTNVFLNDGILPVLYTCDGKDISPSFSWTKIPAKTQSLALILSDPDAPNGTFYHWVVYNLPANATMLAEGETKLPTGAMLGKNSWDKLSYNGPCPPKGSIHTYVFNLYAVNTKLKLSKDADAASVIAALQGHILGTAKLTAVYSRWGS